VTEPLTAPPAPELPPGPPPPPLTGEHLARVAGLRTAASPGVINPVPVVTLAGDDLATGTTGDGPVALDDLAVTWGRSEALDQPSPATATLRLWDPTGTWAIGRELIGQPLDLSWTAVKPGAGPVRQAFFRGRITSAKLAPRSVSNTPDGMLIELGASSLLNDLANRVPFQDWPEETLEQRRARIATFTAGVASSVTVRTFWQDAHVEPVAAADQPSILDSLTALYDSTGPDRLAYFPDTRQVYFIGRHRLNAHSLAQLWWNLPGDGTARAGQGAYIRARGLAAGANENSLAAPAQYLDASAVEYSGELSKDITSRITRVEVAHKDALSTPTTFAERVETALVPGTAETTQGVRSVRHDSLVCWNNYAQTAAADLAALAAEEGSGWSTGSLTYRADLAGGFENFEQVSSLLLCGVESPSLVFLQRSWLPQVGIRPVFVVIGGQIRYAGGWQVEFDVLPGSSMTNPQHAMTWEEIDDGTADYELQWWDEDNPRGLHESVTYEDMGYVGFGLAVANSPADAGWDQVYQQ
jgi:hypothetical protein